MSLLAPADGPTTALHAPDAHAARIHPCLWFDGCAEEAARFYVEVFPNSRLGHVARYAASGREVHGHAEGAVMTVEFSLDGVPFLALNGGPRYRLTPAVSFVVRCDTQADIDHYWARLAEGGDPAAQQCGWLADRFGVSWQVVPRHIGELLGQGAPDPAARERAFAALMQMRKLDIAALERARDGVA
jgi:predicted 3-demethylubiquinone-9 3-methyltransferase (glyoxalase superfamily)